MKIGILDFEHILRPEDILFLRQQLQQPVFIEDLQQINKIDGLIIYGQDKAGFEMLSAHKQQIKLPVFGLGNGLLFMAQKILGEKDSYAHLGLLNITIKSNNTERNEKVLIPVLGRELIPVSYRNTPEIINVGPNVGILSTQGSVPVMVRQGDYLGASFYPEIAKSVKIFGYFYEMVEDAYV